MTSKSGFSTDHLCWVNTCEYVAGFVRLCSADFYRGTGNGLLMLLVHDVMYYINTFIEMVDNSIAAMNILKFSSKIIGFYIYQNAFDGPKQMLHCVFCIFRKK